MPTFSGPVTNTLTSIGSGATSPAILSNPVSLTTNAGATVTFTAAAVGSGPLSYQWLKNSAPLANGGNIAGASGPTLTLSGVTGANVGAYGVVVTNLAGSATSAMANLTIVLPPQFEAATLLADRYPSFSISARQELPARLATGAVYSYLPDFYVRHYRDDDLVSVYGYIPETFQPFGFEKGESRVWLQGTFLQNTRVRATL